MPPNDSSNPTVRFVRLGLTVGLVASAWAVLVYAAGSHSPGERLEPPLPQTIATYLLSGTAGGAILGTLLPLYRSIFGAYLLGILCLLPVYLGFSWVQDPQEGWGSRLGLALLTGALVGGPVAVGQWLRDHGRSEAPSWVNTLRYPTRTTLATAWFLAAGLAGLAWHIGTRWAGKWQATAAIPLFIGPLAFAVGITIVAVRRSSSSP